MRVLGFEARLIGRRRAWWRKSISIRTRSYRAGDYGYVGVRFKPDPPKPLANLFFSSAGFMAEWTLLYWLWTIIRAHSDQQSWVLAAFKIVVLASTLKSFECALSDAKGDDLYEVRRSLKTIAKRVRRR